MGGEGGEEGTGEGGKGGNEKGMGGGGEVREVEGRGERRGKGLA